jgi:hypothetical protein
VCKFFLTITEAQLIRFHTSFSLFNNRLIYIFWYQKKTVITTKWYITAAGSDEVGGVAVEPQLGEEDINSMTIEELRDFINKGVAPTALQSGESNTDLVRFMKRANAKLKGTYGTVIFFCFHCR